MTAQSTLERFAQPQDIDAVTHAFPANVIGTLMPVASDIPEAFWSWSNAWNRWAQACFSHGWPTDHRVFPRDDVDAELAATHLHTLLRSYEPKHEHKLAAVGYLASRWFERIEDES